MQLGPTNLTLNAVDSTYYASIWRNLKQYLTPTAMLTFYSCIAGAGQEGTGLLTAISTRLPGRTIVGFDVYGLMGSAGLPNAPGNMAAQMGGAAGLAMPRQGSLGSNLTPWGYNAKWAHNGRLVRIPMVEQMFKVDRDGGHRNRCANEACLGHATPQQRCQAWSGCRWNP